MREYPALYSFNRGIVSPLGLARIDQKRITLAAETMDNWMPRVLGSMSIRPGWQYLGRTASDNAARYLPFVFGTNDVALVEFTNVLMRVWINDALLTRSSVSTTVTNGTFSGAITGWTDGSDSGGAIASVTGNYLGITGNGTARAIAYQAVSVSSTDQATEHGLKIVIARGPVTLRVGTTSTADDLVTETVLDTGTHSIAFTPNASTFYVQFQSTAAYQVLVQQCTVEAAGTVTITSPFLTADLGNIRFDQSGDVIYVASGYQQRKVERRGTRPNARSWSLCLYHADDGPFLTENFTPTTITPSALTGDVTLTASRPLFRSTQVGGLFKITAIGQTVTAAVTAQNQFSTAIKVTGVGPQRSFTVIITGTFVATVTLQSSLVSATGPWSDNTPTWTAPVTVTLNDALDNLTVWYRIGVKTGNFTSGEADVKLSYTVGTTDGVVRITTYSSSTSVGAQVLTALGDTTATAIWSEGTWSDYRGWPSAVRLHEGRLWFSGKNGVFGSVSDDFTSFDTATLGDSGPIIRTIGSGPVDTINWLLSLQRLVLGAQGAEISARSSALDSPLTPTDFSLKTVSTQGSSAVDAIKLDQQGIYVDRTGVKVYQLEFDLKNYLYPDYSSNDLTALVPELGNNNGTAGVMISRMAVQRKPDTRIHCIRSDGVAMIYVHDKVEEVSCWVTASTTGTVEDVVVLPGAAGSTEDQVYYVVKRTINGATVRHLEKWAKETECRGSTLNKQADAFIAITNAPPSSTLSGLSHLEGASVVVWADGVDYSPGASGSQTTFTVTGGSTDIGTVVTSAIVGLAYTSQWKSAKLGLQPSMAETMLNQQKRISHLGMVAAWIHAKGIRFGPDFSHLDDLPGVEHGAAVSSSATRTTYDEQEFEFPGLWDTDARLCIQGQSPRPATLLALVPDFEIHS